MASGFGCGNGFGGFGGDSAIWLIVLLALIWGGNGFGGNGGYGVTTASVFSNAIQSGCVAILRLGQRSFRAIARLLKKDNPVLSKSPNIAIEGM